MAYTKVSKPISSYSSVNKFDYGFLLLQTGDYCLFQDGSKIIIQERQDNIYSNVAKNTTSYGSVAKT